MKLNKIIVLLLLVGSLSANCYKNRWYTEVKFGYFYPTEKVLREIFDHGGFSIRGEADYEFSIPLALWLDGGWWGKTGTAIGGTEKTRINIGSITAGLKGFWHFNEMASLYLGAGPRVFLVGIRNYSRFVKQSQFKARLGGGFIGGFLIFPMECRRAYIDLFLDYSLRDIGFAGNSVASETHDLKVDGLTAGIGLGHRF